MRKNALQARRTLYKHVGRFTSTSDASPARQKATAEYTFIYFIPYENNLYSQTTLLDLSPRGFQRRDSVCSSKIVKTVFKMVKIQKPVPKSMAKPANIHGVKKEKPAKENKAIPASNPTAKKAKTKLIEKSIQELKSVKPIKNVVKQEAAQDKKGGKNKQKKNKVKQEISPKKDNATTPPPPPPPTKKSVVKAGNEVQKPAPQKSVPAQKKSNTENKAQQQQGKKQKKNTENKPQPQTGKNQKKGAKDAAANAEQKLNKKQKNKEEEKSATKFEAQPFDEEQFNKVVNLENIKKISKALKKLVETEVSEKKTSIFSDYRYFLNVCSYKIPNVPKRIVKL